MSLIAAIGCDDDVGGGKGDATSWVLRLGTRDTFSMTERLGLGPEIVCDVLEGGQRRGVFALALTDPC